MSFIRNYCTLTSFGQLRYFDDIYDVGDNADLTKEVLFNRISMMNLYKNLKIKLLLQVCYVYTIQLKLGQVVKRLDKHNITCTINL